MTKVPNIVIEELKQIQKNFLKNFWVKRLYTEKFHQWKIIPLQYINKRFGKNFKFHSKLNIPKNTLSYFPSFYKNILKIWGKY